MDFSGLFYLKFDQDFTLDTFIKIFNYVYINKTFAL